MKQPHTSDPGRSPAEELRDLLEFDLQDHTAEAASIFDDCAQDTETPYHLNRSVDSVRDMLDRKRAGDRRRRWQRTFVKRAAVVLLVLGVAFGVVVQVDAIWIPLKNLFRSDLGDNVQTVLVESERDLVAKGVYYVPDFSDLPDYYISEANIYPGYVEITCPHISADKLIIFEIYSDEMTHHIDSEKDTGRTVEIGGGTGYYTEAEGTAVVEWSRGNTVFKLRCPSDVDAVYLADSIRYIG